MTKLNIDDHLAFKKYKSIARIASHFLAKTPFNYFCYQRIYKSGHYTFLATHPMLADYFYNDGMYSEKWYYKMSFDKIHDGLLIWDLAKQYNNPAQMEIYDDLVENYSLVHGFDLIKKYDEYYDVYCFSGDALAVYQYDILKLWSFIYYFRQEALPLITCALKQKFYIPLQNEKLQNFPIILQQPSSILSSDLPDITSKFYLHGIHEGKSITNKELSYLRLFHNGKSSKEIAKKFNISFRTVENSISRLKDKLECKRTIELINILKINHLII